MKYLTNDASLSNTNYTNHSIRATCITILDRARFEARHIITVSGHKSENSIKKYAKGCSTEKKREMSNALALPKIQPKMPKIEKPAPPQINSELATTPLAGANFDLNAMDLFPIHDVEEDDALLAFINQNPNFENAVAVQEDTTKNQEIQQLPTSDINI